MTESNILRTLNDLAQNKAIDPETKAFATVFEAARELPYYEGAESSQFQGGYPVDCIFTFKPGPGSDPIGTYRQLNLFSALVDGLAQEHDITLSNRYVFRSDDKICLKLELKDGYSCAAFKLLTNNLGMMLREATADKKRQAYETPLDLDPPFSL